MKKLTDPIPLRTSLVWPQYQVASTLPVVFGDYASVECVPYLNHKDKWLVSDSVIQAIRSINHSGVTATLETTVDAAGHPISLINLSQTVDQLTAVVAGTVTDAGELAQRPDQILDYIFNKIAGITKSTSDFDNLRAYASTNGLTFAGVLNDHTITTQTWIDRLCQGSGLVWSPEITEIAIPWPQEPGNYTESLNDHDLVSEVDSDSLITVLNVSFDNEASSFTLVNTEALREHGTREGNLALTWVTSRVVAEEIATRYLKYYSRPLWTITGTVEECESELGSTVNLTDLRLPINLARLKKRIHRITSQYVEFEAPYGSPGTVTVSSTGSLT